MPIESHTAQRDLGLRPTHRIRGSGTDTHPEGKLEHILKSGWYLLELVNDLLDLAQIESGNMSVTQVPVSLAEVMLECRAMMAVQAN
jgi:signal transduction histidine kinase